MDGCLGIPDRLCTDYVHRLMKIICQIIIIMAKYQIWNYMNLSNIDSNPGSLNYLF